jgi:hypothetical protein
MKIDTQGFEGFVLKGGEEMFLTKPPLHIFMEFSPHAYKRYGVDGAQMLKDMIGYGYSIKTIDGQDITLTNGKLEELSVHYKDDSDLDFEVDLELTHELAIARIAANQGSLFNTRLTWFVVGVLATLLVSFARSRLHN